MEKNYNVNNAIKLASTEIKKLKEHRQKLKDELNYGMGKISLGNFDVLMSKAKRILQELHDSKKKLLALYQLNQRYIKEANGGRYPSKVNTRCNCAMCKSDSAWVDFVLNRQEVINLTGALVDWLDSTKGKPIGKETLLSLQKKNLYSK